MAYCGLHFKYSLEFLDKCLTIGVVCKKKKLPHMGAIFKLIVVSVYSASLQSLGLAWTCFFSCAMSHSNCGEDSNPHPNYLYSVIKSTC